MTLGGNILRIRNEKNISAAKLGQLVGVSKQMIYQYEKNESVPGKEILDGIAKSLSVSVSDLYAGRSASVEEVAKKIMDLDVWEEIKINSEEIRRNNATFKQEIDKLWAERDKFWNLINALTPAVELRKPHKG